MERLWLLVVVLAGLLPAGCGEEKLTVQDNLKGTWRLTARALSDGTVFKPPEVNGVMEWYAIDDRHGHLSVAISENRDGRKSYDFESDMLRVSPSQISLERSLLMGRSYLHGDGPAEADITPRSASGGLAIVGTVVTLRLANQITHRFEGSSLTVTVPDRFTDTWKKD